MPDFPFAGLALLALVVNILNLPIWLHNYFKKKNSSPIPLVGGLLGCLILSFGQGKFIWLPLLLDVSFWRIVYFLLKERFGRH